MILILAESSSDVSGWLYFWGFLWVAVTIPLIGFVIYITTRKQATFPMIDGGKVFIQSSSHDRVPTSDACFRYLITVLQSLDPNANPDLKGARTIHLPSGAIVRVKAPKDESPTVNELRYHLRMAEQMVEMMAPDTSPEQGSNKPWEAAEEALTQAQDTETTANRQKSTSIQNNSNHQL